MNNKGGIDVGAWITAIVGFTFVWIMWTTFTPAIDILTRYIGHGQITLDPRSTTLVDLVQKIWNYGMVLNAAGWILYILWSSIRREVGEEAYGVEYE
jgi:hypothetical protein